MAGGHGEYADHEDHLAQHLRAERRPDGLTGHSHFYQRNLLNGIHHIQIGTVGAVLDTVGSASYVQKSVRDFCFAIFDMTPTTLHMAVYEDGGTQVDTIDLSIGPLPTPTPTPTPPA